VQKKQARVLPGDSAEVGEAYVFFGMDGLMVNPRRCDDRPLIY
jgi:hypothetical protein